MPYRAPGKNLVEYFISKKCSSIFKNISATLWKGRCVRSHTSIPKNIYSLIHLKKCITTPYSAILPRMSRVPRKIINLTRPSEEFPSFILFAVRVTAFCRVSPLKNFPADAPAKDCSLRISDAFFRITCISSRWRNEIITGEEGREEEVGVMDKLMTRGDVNPVSHVGGLALATWDGLLKYRCTRLSFINTGLRGACMRRTYVQMHTSSLDASYA